MTDKDKEILKAYYYGYSIKQISEVEQVTILYIETLIKEKESQKFLDELRRRSYD